MTCLHQNSHQSDVRSVKGEHSGICQPGRFHLHLKTLKVRCVWDVAPPRGEKSHYSI